MSTAINQSLKIAFQHQSARNWEAAAAIYRKILAENPTHGNAYHLFGQTDLAIQYMKQAIACEGTNAAFHHNLGLVYVHAGKSEDAAACFSAAIRLKPDYPEAYNNLGNVLRLSGRTQDAMANYQDALFYRPDYADAAYNLGTMLTELGRLDEAAIYLKMVKF
jgi:tetratricopeptide (TPR) repeat protein